MPKWLVERLNFFSQIFSYWWLWVLLAWSLFSNAATIRDNFFPTELQAKWGTLRVIPKFPWYVWAIGLLAFMLLATMEGAFRVWRSERQKSQSSLAYLQASVAFSPNPLPLGQPIKLYLSWRNVGIAPALNPIPHGKIVLLPTEVSVDPVRLDAELLNEWKLQLERHYQAKGPREFVPIFANQPPTQHLVTGPVLTKEELDDLVNARKQIIVIGAVRFRDGNGLHEARACKRLVEFDMLTNNARFADCYDYVTQVDLPDN